MNYRHAMPLLGALTAAGFLFSQAQYVSSLDYPARDPGVREGPEDAGGPLDGLTGTELSFFNLGLDEFAEAEAADEGLGPTMNLDGCGGCHAQPAIGGTSPAVNPQVAFASKEGARNRIPSFIREDGPVREARFVRNRDGTRDGGVHALFTIAGRYDAPGCELDQPDFEAEVARGNVVFRIPTPVFGAGLIEQIPDSAILANQLRDGDLKSYLGIRGRPNIVLAFGAISGQPNLNGNDGTVARFGWKAQNKSLLLFSGEAYNVEMGITNDLFQTERDETESCQYATVPNDVQNMEAGNALEGTTAIQSFTNFQRFLAPPKPSPDTPGGADSIRRGRGVFATIGCALCHTPSFRTGNATVAALRYQRVDLYSDLLLHDMGVELADGVVQGQAGPREFRTAPLWGLGKRIFLLHDGRTSNLKEAIRAHASSGSEANAVVANYRGLRESDKQDLLNFLRSL